MGNYAETGNLLDYFAESKTAYREHFSEKQFALRSSPGMARVSLPDPHYVTTPTRGFIRKGPLQAKIDKAIEHARMAEILQERREALELEWNVASALMCKQDGAIVRRWRLQQLQGIEPTIAEIMRVVGVAYDIALSDMRGAYRNKPIVVARQEVMLLARGLTRLSLPIIGNHIGGKDHTTVLYAIQKICAARKLPPAGSEGFREYCRKRFAELKLNTMMAAAE